MAKSLKQLREEARACQACPLWANATQTVFGAGDPHARVMLVGEQPGDEEDKKGLPFVGPAGRRHSARSTPATSGSSRRSQRCSRMSSLPWAPPRRAR
jgi:uracil-DNA glycosylase family 4